MTWRALHARLPCLDAAEPTFNQLCISARPWVLVVSPVDGGNLVGGGDASQTMESFVRMLTCLPVSWPASVTVAAATAATVAAACSRGGARWWGENIGRGKVVTLKHLGPSGGKAMTLRALRAQQLRAAGVTLVDSDGIDAGDVTWTRLRAVSSEVNAVGGGTGARRPTHLSPAASAADNAGGLHSHVMAAVLNAVRAVAPDSTLAGAGGGASLDDAPLVSAAGLNSAQALAVAASLRRTLGLPQLSDLVLYDRPTAAAVAAHVCALVHGGGGGGGGTTGSECSDNYGDRDAGVGMGLVNASLGMRSVAAAAFGGHPQGGRAYIAGSASRRCDPMSAPRDGVTAVAARSAGEDDRVCQLSSAFG